MSVTGAHRYQVMIQPVTVCDTVRFVDLKDGYRYGFGSHEKIDEVSGTGNTVDMGDRWLDVRLGRTPKMDAMAYLYPGISPYAYVANSPLMFIDTDGKKIKGVRYNNKTGQYDFSKSAIKRGTDIYINARIVNESGRAAVKDLVDDKRTYKITVTDKVIMGSYSNNQGGENYSYLGGLTLPGSWFVLTTNEMTNADVIDQGDENGKVDVFVINNRGNLKSKTIKTSQIQSPYSNQDSEYAKEYSQARKDSGYDDYMSNQENLYTSTEEKLHNVGAHEETHLKQPSGLSTYNSEKAAFSNEFKAAIDYKETKRNK